MYNNHLIIIYFYLILFICPIHRVFSLSIPKLRLHYYFYFLSYYQIINHYSIYYSNLSLILIYKMKLEKLYYLFYYYFTFY